MKQTFALTKPETHMKSASELFVELAELIKKTFPNANESEMLVATNTLVGLAIQAQANEAAFSNQKQ